MPMDEKYFGWLYEKVRPSSKPDLLQYTKVCEIAHRIIFNWIVPNDDNRAADGKELRDDFMREIGVNPPPDKEWMGLDCSMFEMMVGLAIRCDFLISLGLPMWFDIFMGNLELDHYNDALYDPSATRRINFMLNRLNDRSYRSNGFGGLFPLHNPSRDQREVEIWYQMSEFMKQNRMY